MPRRTPSLESLRVFEAGARRQNLARAAEELGVSATAVSLRIRDLERDLGVALFRRRGPRISLTDPGAVLAGRLGELLAGIDEAVEACRAAVPPVRLTVTPTLAARWLGPRLARYAAQSDAAPIQLDVSTDVRGPEDFDVAVRSGRGDWPGLEARALAPRTATPMLSAALAARTGVRQPSDLAKLDLAPDADWPRWFAEAGVERSLRYAPVHYPTQELAAGAAVAGAAVALLSPELFAPLLEDGRLIQPFTLAIASTGGDWVVMRRGESRRALLALADALAAP